MELKEPDSETEPLPQEQKRIIDEYGYARTREDLSGDKLGKGIQSITRQREWWASEFPGGIIDESLAQKWRKRSETDSATSSQSSHSSSGRRLIPPPSTLSSGSSKIGDRLTKAIRLGVPPELREIVWLKCTGASLKKQEAKPHDQYAVVLRRAEQGSSNAAQIEKDLRRTMPTNEHFQKEEGIDALRCVLLAYSERNKELGYCQSMNFIAAILLLHMECDDVFWCLAAIVEDILPKHWFDGELHGSLAEPMVLESCVRWKLPKLYQHLYDLDVKFTQVTYPWFLSLFTGSLPLEPMLRVWDCFFHEGLKALQRVAMGLLVLRQEEILALQDELEVFELLRSPSVSIASEQQIDGDGQAPSRFATAFTADGLFEAAFHIQTDQMPPKKKKAFFRRATMTYDPKLNPKPRSFSYMPSSHQEGEVSEDEMSTSRALRHSGSRSFDSAPWTEFSAQHPELATEMMSTPPPSKQKSSSLLSTVFSDRSLSPPSNGHEHKKQSKKLGGGGGGGESFSSVMSPVTTVRVNTSEDETALKRRLTSDMEDEVESPSPSNESPATTSLATRRLRSASLSSFAEPPDEPIRHTLKILAPIDQGHESFEEKLPPPSPSTNIAKKILKPLSHLRSFHTGNHHSSSGRAISVSPARTEPPESSPNRRPSLSLSRGLTRESSISRAVSANSIEERGVSSDRSISVMSVLGPKKTSNSCMKSFPNEKLEKYRTRHLNTLRADSEARKEAAAKYAVEHPAPLPIPTPEQPQPTPAPPPIPINTESPVAEELLHHAMDVPIEASNSPMIGPSRLFSSESLDESVSPRTMHQFAEEALNNDSDGESDDEVVYEAILVKSVQDMGLVSPISSRKQVQDDESKIYDAVILKKANVNSDSSPTISDKVDEQHPSLGEHSEENSSGELIEVISAPTTERGVESHPPAEEDDHKPGRLKNTLTLDLDVSISTSVSTNGHHQNHKHKGLRIGSDEDGSSHGSSDFSEDDEGFGSPIPGSELREEMAVRTRSAERDSISTPHLAHSPSLNEAAINRLSRDSKAAEGGPRLSYVNAGRNPIANDAQNHSFLLPQKRNMSITRFINI